MYRPEKTGGGPLGLWATRKVEQQIVAAIKELAGGKIDRRRWDKLGAVAVFAQKLYNSIKKTFIGAELKGRAGHREASEGKKGNKLSLIGWN